VRGFLQAIARKSAAKDAPNADREGVSDRFAAGVLHVSVIIISHAIKSDRLTFTHPIIKPYTI